MRKLLLSLGAAALIALVSARVAAADGPMFVTQDGGGVVRGSLRYVAVNTVRGQDTDLVEVSGRDHSVGPALRLRGAWGLPYTPAGAEGLSHDGRTLVLGRAGVGVSSPSRFLVVDPRQMQVVRTISLDGYFSYDALSPDASRLYLIQYTHGSSQDTSHYIVRAYDMRTDRLLPGKIADRTDDEKTMAGYAMTRTTSADGRWVYTLYQKPSGAPFVHALDTVGGVAHCIDLPANRSLYNIVLSLRGGGRTLAVHWRSGRAWLNVAVGSWRISRPGGGFPWTWTAAAIGGGLAVLAGGGLLLRRRRREEIEQHAGQELGLA
jgi:LPXTG-motif cell wall-anchored protein